MGKLTGYEQEVKRGDTLSAQFNLLNACPSQCLTCQKYMWPRDKMPVEKALDVLKALSMVGCTSVVFSGGDPLLYDGLIDLVDRAGELGMATSVITTLMKSRVPVDRLSDSLTRMHVSIDGSTKERYAAVRGKHLEDSFNEMIMALANVANRRAERGQQRPRISMVLSNLTCDDVIGMYHLVTTLGCDINYYLVHQYPEYDLNTEQRDMAVTDLIYVGLKANADGVQTNALDLSRSLLEGDVGNKVHKGRCYIPNVSCIIGPDGDVYPCCNLYDDNGPYRDQLEYRVCNLMHCDTAEQMANVLKTRNGGWKFPIDCKYCRQCFQRIDGIYEDLQRIIEGKKEPVFI